MKKSQSKQGSAAILAHLTKMEERIMSALGDATGNTQAVANSVTAGVAKLNTDMQKTIADLQAQNPDVPSAIKSLTAMSAQLATVLTALGAIDAAVTAADPTPTPPQA